MDEGRLAKAKELGADYTVKVESRDGKEVAEKIKGLLGLADKTIECTGVESSICTGIYVSALVVFCTFICYSAASYCKQCNLLGPISSSILKTFYEKRQ